MSEKVTVHVVQEKDRANLTMRYRDPLTGKLVKRSTGTANRKAALKKAAQWEAEVNEGRYSGRQLTTWTEFRSRYESEVLPSLAKRTALKVGTVLDAVERILPRVGTGKLSGLDSAALSRFQAELRQGKRAESTIAGYLAHLRAALQWAVDQDLLTVLPKIRRPKRAKKSGRGTLAKGRPLSLEEFERMLAKVPAALVEQKHRKRLLDHAARGKPGSKPTSVDIPIEVNPIAVESWRHYLRGLWLSGLRLQESTNLYWDRQDRLCIDLSGRRPRLMIPGEFEKGGQDRRLPVTPDFAELLLATPPEERHGRVFRPLTASGVASAEQAGKMVALIGELAGVKVHTHPITGKVKYASAHDLRRSFGTRWAKRCMPAVLQKLMRHESIGTTMAFYVDLDTDALADELWKGHEKAQEGTISGTIAAGDSDSITAEDDLNPCKEGD